MRGLLLWLLVLSASGVWADDLRPATLVIEAISADSYRVSWKLPLKNDRPLPLSVHFDDSVKVISQVKTTVVDAASLQRWQIQRAGGLAGASVQVQGLDAVYTDVLIRVTEHDGRVVSAVLGASQPSYAFTDAVTGAPVSAYLWSGMEHIWIGLDHLLFVACLVYLSGTARKLLWTITGFTVAHSITLFMAALDWVRVPIPPVEAAIALSIVFLAREIAIHNPRSLSVRYPVAVAASFGLLHGFGFASVLADVGLPRDDTVLALLLFNVGVEVGQLLFVGVLLVIGHLLASRLALLSPARLRLWVSYSAGSLASIWMITRLSAF